MAGWAETVVVVVVVGLAVAAVFGAVVVEAGGGAEACTKVIGAKSEPRVLVVVDVELMAGAAVAGVRASVLVGSVVTAAVASCPRDAGTASKRAASAQVSCLVRVGIMFFK